ncbi:MAG: glycosyltransferase family 1 protein [Daejeonella sp.]
MKIGFDGKRTTQNFTGLGNYSRYVIKLLTKFYPENRYSVYSLKPPAPGFQIPSVDYHYPARRFFKAFWRSYGIADDLKKDEIDLYHGLSNEIPFSLKKTGIPSVVTIHDLIFLRYPGYYPFIDRKIYEFKFSYAAANADKIIAISEQTKRDIMHYLGATEKNIEVVYQNCDPIFHRRISDEEKLCIREAYNLPASYLLNVGTIEERKNLILTVKALKGLKDIQLVVIGKETPYAKKVKEYIKSNGLANRVHFLQNVRHTDLPAIYQQAEVFIYPSKFEGFGIPIIEALHSGVPVIAATGSCLEEAGGPGSMYTDPENSEQLTCQIRELLNDHPKKRQMILDGYEHLKNFGDEKIAGQLTGLYRKILNNA